MALKERSSVKSRSSFGTLGRVITPNNSTDVADAPVKAVICLTSGNIAVIPTNNADGSPIAFVGVSAGFIPPFEVRRVMATGTTATVATVED
ncbi:hypothetical protein [Rhizobium sp. Leaf386]|uniref:spike base protein, RCAP_Rcc01079 family n=1 Tax=Rhizobium sp. Leaf386 TaxID=1736359 RepID=UPI000714EFA1|nr:hypothetical protein [Rhizobium sp. Leaf386]KQS84130.1 hypothetical protein ASG50_30025 [Rhizobium sp. Leaf386]